MTPEGEPMVSFSELAEDVADEVREQTVDDRGVKPRVLVPVALVGFVAVGAIIVWSIRNR